MTSAVYVLWHHYPDGPDADNAKLLGVYSSHARAEERIEVSIRSCLASRKVGGNSRWMSIGLMRIIGRAASLGLERRAR
jgi:hypothetical protein